MLIDGFPQNLSMLLKHMILSHHGQYDFGSPKRPKTIEATVLNYLDDLDSKINGIQTHMEKEQDNRSRWTAYHRLYDRYYYRENSRTEAEGSSPMAVQTPAAPEVVREPEPELLRVPSRPAAPERRESRPTFQNNPFVTLKEKV
jgi:3'-5' exoribonuclease